MLEKILVPLDGSPLAECVLDHVRTLFQAFDSKITLLRVLERNSDPKLNTENPIEWYLQKAEAETYLQQLTSQLTKSGLQSNYVLLEGSAPQKIIEYTHQHEIDLIILSSHGTSGLSRWNISSVVHKVISQAHTSIMIVRAYTASQDHQDFCYDRVLVPLDGSTRAENVLPVASTLVCPEHGELILGHIASQPQIFHRVPLTIEEQEQVNEWAERNRNAATDYLTKLQPRLTVTNRLHVEVGDDVIEALHDLAEQEAVDLIVLSAHGISGKRRWPYGSLVNSFIIYGVCPLLIVQDMARDEIDPTEAELASQSSDQGANRMTNYAHI